jgi:hypothetical protein
MLNRTKSIARDSLDDRRAVGAELREAIQDLPASPFEWGTFDPAAVFDARSPDLRLANLARTLCAAPARAADLRALWSESVATAAYAFRLAPHLGADSVTSAIAGLLHRFGDLLTVRAIGTVEQAHGVRLDAASKADLCAEHGVMVLDHAVRAWTVPARAAAMAVGWRNFREFPGAAADAAVVHLARFMAIEAVSPRFCAPGIVEVAAEELGVSAALLGMIRTQTDIGRLTH